MSDIDLSVKATKNAARNSPPVHMIKLTKEREIAPYVWVHPDGQR